MSHLSAQFVETDRALELERGHNETTRYSTIHWHFLSHWVRNIASEELRVVKYAEVYGTEAGGRQYDRINEASRVNMW